MTFLGRAARLLLLTILTGCAGGDTATPTAATPAVPTFQITGTIRDGSASTPIAGATLSVMDGPNVGKSATTAADGRYALASLVAGSFTLRVQRDGYDDYNQQMSVTSNTNFDLRMTPGRSLASGWSGGTLYATVDGQQVGARVTSAQVTQNGTTLNGLFSCADGSTGTFTGQVAAGRFTGSMRVEMAFNNPARRCPGTAANLTGTATGNSIDLAAPSLALESCAGSVTGVALTLTP